VYNPIEIGGSAHSRKVSLRTTAIQDPGLPNETMSPSATCWKLLPKILTVAVFVNATAGEMAEMSGAKEYSNETLSELSSSWNADTRTETLPTL
jgi:hypothetical protein